MKKIILSLILVLNTMFCLKGQNLFNTFNYNTVTLNNVTKEMLYERVKTFFSDNKNDKEFIYFNSLPLYKTEINNQTLTNNLISVNGFINTTFSDEKGFKYNIGVSCYDGKYIYYITYDNGVNKGVIEQKITNLKESMSILNGIEKGIKVDIDNNCDPIQCSGVTQKDNRCKRKTTNCNGRCFQHQ